MSDQLKTIAVSQNILNDMQSGFKSGHSTVSATLKVIDDLKAAIDKRLFCMAVFINLTKAFDTVDPSMLIKTLLNIGVGHRAENWFQSYL